MNSVFLVGPMGAGKTAVGRPLARELDKQFFDSDLEIQQRTGVDVGFIFEKEGEQGFRARERDAIAQLTQIGDIVLATGGGAVMDPDNRKHLSGRGVVVYLRASVAQQLQRTRMNRQRPLLDHDDPEQVLRELAEQRDPIYREIASIVVDTDGRKVPAVVTEIAEKFRREFQETQAS